MGIAGGVMRGFNRLLAAIVLTGLSITVPLVAWYSVGSEAARRDAERAVGQVTRQARSVAIGLAERLHGRLEAIKDAESRRPVYHYEPHFHDPTSDCACASLTPSPLARGSGESLIEAYFQIDQGGRFTLPTLPIDQSAADPMDDDTFVEEVRMEFGANIDPSWVEGQRTLRVRLAPIAEQVAGETIAGGVTQIPSASWSGEPLEDDPRRLEQPGKPRPGQSSGGFPGFTPLEEETLVRVSPFAWRQVVVSGRPTLIAIRDVVTFSGSLTQGFVVSSREANRSLMGEFYPATFVPGPPENGTIGAVVALEGAPWFVEVDASPVIRQAEEQGAGVVSRFRRTFLWVSLAAVLAGLSLVGIVWQSERLARQRSRFAASAAHELRTPLAGLRVYADMLSEQLGDPDRSRQYARHVASEAERLGRVVSNVLEYSQLERGALRVRPEPGDLGLAVRECVDTLEAALISAGATVEFRVDPDLPPVPFDRDAMFHIVQNLLDNAEKYTRQAEDRRIEVGLTLRQDRAVLSVTDHGPGLSEEARRNIFRPFTRAEQPDAPPGLGLGLTLARALAEAHGATVSYEDAPGGGAVFAVAFPLASGT